MTLKKLRGLLKPDGVLCFDVNNRHWRGYGRLRVTWRRALEKVPM